jgi:putative FmdB family regulatory protein
MPIYEFVCETCDAEFEQLFKSASDESAVSCPECGGSRTHKKFSTFAVSTSEGGGSSPSPCCTSCPAQDCASRKS